MKKLKNLIQIINIVSKQKINKIELLGNINSNSLLNKLYSGIHDGLFSNDNEAAMSLYKSTPQNRNYRKLKYNLEVRLINTIFFLGSTKSRFTTSTRAKINTQKNWAAAQILLGLGAKNLAIKIAEKTIRKSLLFEYTVMTLEIARILNTHYLLYEPNKKKQKYYFTIAEEQKKNLDIEIIAENYYHELMTLFSQKRGAYNEELIDSAKSYAHSLKSKIKNQKSKKLTYYKHHVFVLRHELEMNHSKVIECCYEGIKDFEQNGDRAGKISMYIRLIISFISLKKFNEAEAAINKISMIYPQGSYYWFIINELKLIKYFHKGDYQKAIEIQVNVGFHKKIKILPSSLRAGWKLYAAYLHYFKENNIVTFEKYEKHFKQFRLRKFLNDIPDAFKDKKGLNIQILIIQVLFLLKKDQIDEAIDRMQFLNQYRRRYLIKDNTYRSNVFIRMLIVLIRNQMHREAVTRKAAKYLKMLQDHPIEKSKQSIGIEVVPFEDLWELIIADTKNEFRFTPAKMRKVEAAFGTRKKVKNGK